MAMIDLDPQGHFGLKLTNCSKIWLVLIITHQVFNPETPYSHKTCILELFQMLLKMETIFFHDIGSESLLGGTDQTYP